MAYTLSMRLLLLLGVCAFTLAGVHAMGASVPDGCKTIRSSLCDDILRYRVARFPNLVGSSNSREAAQAVDNMFPSFMVQMAPNMIRVMCQMYFPECVEGQAATLPCRSLCEAASEESARLMSTSGGGGVFSMPCESFPVCDEVSHNTTVQGDRSEWHRNMTSHNTTIARPRQGFGRGGNRTYSSPRPRGFGRGGNRTYSSPRPRGFGRGANRTYSSPRPRGYGGYRNFTTPRPSRGGSGRNSWNTSMNGYNTSYVGSNPPAVHVFEEVSQSSGPDFPVAMLNSLISGYKDLMNATTELAEAKQEMVKEQTKLAREQTKLAQEQTKLAKMESRRIWLESKRRKKSKA